MFIISTVPVELGIGIKLPEEKPFLEPSVKAVTVELAALRSQKPKHGKESTKTIPIPMQRFPLYF